MWTGDDDLDDRTDTTTYIKCFAESPCGVEYYKENKWTEFYGKPIEREGTPLADDATHSDGSPATEADCPRICAERDDCTAFYHNSKTDECELFSNNENWAVSKVGVDFSFDDVDGGYTMAKCQGRCLQGWGKDTHDCFPESVEIECTADGLKLNAHIRLVFNKTIKFFSEIGNFIEKPSILFENRLKTAFKVIFMKIIIF